MELNKEERYYQNNQLKYRFYYDENLMVQGLHERYYNDGSLIERGQYKDGIEIGLWLEDRNRFIYYL